MGGGASIFVIKVSITVDKKKTLTTKTTQVKDHKQQQTIAIVGVVKKFSKKKKKKKRLRINTALNNTKSNGKIANKHGL